MPYVAKTRLYHTLDRKRVVKEGDPDAAFLLIGEGAVVAEAEAERLGITRLLDDHDYDPLATEEAAMKDAIGRGALYEAQSRQNTVERMKMAREAGLPVAVAAGVPASPADRAAAAATPTNQPAPADASAVTTAPQSAPQSAAPKTADSKK